MDRLRSTRRLRGLFAAHGLMTLLALASASAQTPDGSASSTPAAANSQLSAVTSMQLRQALSPGDLVFIVQTTGVPVKGRLLFVQDSGLVVGSDAQGTTGELGRHLNLTIPYSAIQSLDRPRDSSTNGALFGMGVGLGVWVPFFVHAVAVDRNEMDEWAAGYAVAGAIFAGVGAFAGWVIDTAHSKPHLQFVADSSASRRGLVQPVLARRPGVAVVVSF